MFTNLKIVKKEIYETTYTRRLSKGWRNILAKYRYVVQELGEDAKQNKFLKLWKQ